MMDHEQIEAESVIERYVTRRLSDDEADAFEVHLLDCAPCVERVEAAERLQRGLASVVSEEVTTVGLAAAAARARWAWRFGLAALILLAIGLGARVLQHGDETSLLRQELQQAQDELARRDAVSSAFDASQGAEADSLRERLAEAEDALESNVQARRNLEHQLKTWDAPLANMPIALLTPLRGEENAFDIELPRNGPLTGLWIELGGEDFATYRAELQTPDGQRIWTGENLQFNALGALFIQVPARILYPGRWTLEISGVSDGRPTPIATFSLAVRAP